jgi:hypothetical protein
MNQRQQQRDVSPFLPLGLVDCADNFINEQFGKAILE